jgi:predicted HTH transcriptional regulator
MDSLLSQTTATGYSINYFIARGEGPQLEFKSSIRWDHKLNQVNKDLEKVIARTLAGFMNHSGGTLVIGVTDEGGIVGLDQDIASLSKPNLDGLSLRLTQVLTDYLGEVAAASVDITFADIDGKTVAVASAERATQPVFLEDAGETEFHVRSNASTRRLGVKEATDIIAQHWPATV